VDVEVAEVVEADAADAAADASTLCSAGTGTGVGDIANDVTLMDCAGGTHRLHDLCGTPATLVFSYAGWCPPCQTKAAGAQALFERIGADGAEMWFVISSNAEFGAPTAAYCESVSARFGLGMTVLYDASGALGAALGLRTNDEAVVLDAALRISYSEQYASLAGIEAAVNAVLSP
jgi:peroxiredoxin